MLYSNATISNNRLLSCFDDRSNDFFRVSHIEPEEGDSAPASFCNSTFISEKYLSDAVKKCADYLAMWRIRVNTHNRHARQDTNYSLNTNTLRRVRFLEYLSFPRYYPNLYMPPSPIGGMYRHTSRRCLPEHGATMPANIADVLFY